MYANPTPTLPLIRTGRYGDRPQVTLPDGTKSAGEHRGVDTRAPVGTPVHAVEAGVVIQTRKGWASMTRPGTIEGRRIFSAPAAGNLVVIRDAQGYDHNYGHLLDVAVSVGDKVARGGRIARSGRTGVYAPHLHYGLWLEYAKNAWRSLDPTLLLPWEGDVLDEYELIKPKADSTKPAAPVVPDEPDAAAPIPTPEDDDMTTQTRLYRRKSNGDVFAINPDEGIVHYVGDAGLIGYYRALGVVSEHPAGTADVDKYGIRDLTDDAMRSLVEFTRDAHAPDALVAGVKRSQR